MAFTFYTPFTIATGQVPSTQTSFQAVIKPANDNRWKTVGNGGHVQSSSGFDIRPYSNASLSTPLLFTLISGTYDGTNGSFEMWVNITAQDGNVVYLAYGDTNLTSDGSSTSTWNQNLVVMFPDGTTLSVVDSSPNGRNGTNTGSTATTGKIDGGIHLDGSANKVTFGTSVVTGTISKYSLSIWLKRSSSSIFQHIIDKQGTSSAGFTMQTSSDSSIVGTVIIQSGTFVTAPSGLLTTTELNHFVLVYDGSGVTDADKMKIYYNGSNQTLSVSGGPVPATITSNDTTAFQLGFADASTGDSFYGGDADVLIFINGTAYTANWITTMFNNQSAPTTFWTIGTEVTIDTLFGQSLF